MCFYITGQIWKLRNIFMSNNYNKSNTGSLNISLSWYDCRYQNTSRPRYMIIQYSTLDQLPHKIHCQLRNDTSNLTPVFHLCSYNLSSQVTRIDNKQLYITVSIAAVWKTLRKSLYVQFLPPNARENGAYYNVLVSPAFEHEIKHAYSSCPHNVIVIFQWHEFLFYSMASD